MPIVANLLKPRGLGKRKLEVVDGTGPDSAVTVAAGGSADIPIPISPDLADPEYVGIMSITNLPDGVVLAGIRTSGTAVTLRGRNHTAADITVAVDSITVRALVVGH